MEIFLNICFSIPSDEGRWLDFLASFERYSGDEEFLIPDEPSLEEWFEWLMESESDTFWQCDGFSLESDQAVLRFMPRNPKKFAEAMLRLLEHAGATNLRAHWYSPDREDADYVEFTMVDGKMVGVRKPMAEED